MKGYPGDIKSRLNQCAVMNPLDRILFPTQAKEACRLQGGSAWKMCQVQEAPHKSPRITSSHL